MPSLVSSTGGLIVFGLLLLLSVNAQSELWTNEVSDVQYRRLGTNVTLVCEALGRSSVKWRLNRSFVLPWQHHVTSAGHLVLMNADHNAEGNYSCHDDQGVLIKNIRLRLGHPPGLVSVSCNVPNHSLVLCSWVESVKTGLPAQYHASYRDSTKVLPCELFPPPQQRCFIKEPTFWAPYHDINITGTNALGTQTTIVRVRFYNLLKPDPPEAVIAEGVTGYPMRLQVNWTYPASWSNDPGVFPLRSQLRYRPEGSSIWSTVDREDNHVLITDALAGHAHQLQVRVQDQINSDSQWSDWTPLVEAWPWTGTTAQSTEETPVDYNDTDATMSLPTEIPDVGPPDGSLDVVLLALLAGVILALVSSVVIIMWVKQLRRVNGTKQELTSMVKMKSMPI